MSHAKTPDVEDKRQDRLDTLYELREEFQTVAGTDLPYATYCETALETLREAGYDV